MMTARRDKETHLNPFWPPQSKPEFDALLKARRFEGELKPSDPEYLARIQRDCPELFDKALGEISRKSRFRAWAIRWNERAEDLLAAFNWRALDRLFSNICAVTVTGVILWLAYVLLDAWMRGAFNLGGQ